jgi:RHS repeat-associated protein
MRTNGTLSYLLGDHLGSTSLVTDAAGVVVSETRYKAWGETRYISGTTPTKYQYTGQYSYAADFGLHFYNARWYDSSLSRFTQADTIVPLETQGVQAWDRYIYGGNNPVRYLDPSGHVPIDCYGTNYCWSSALDRLTNRYVSLYHQVEADEISDLEAFAQLAEYAALLTPNCTSCFVNNMGAVLTGFTGATPGLDVIRNRRYPDQYPLNTYYVQLNQDNIRFGQSGFAPIFRDNSGQGDQSRHYWQFVQSAYFEGFAVAWAGNAFHETIDPTARANQKSYQDFVLGIEGSELGFQLGAGFVSPHEVGQHIRDTLSTGTYTDFYWSHPLGTINEYLVWKEQQ